MAELETFYVGGAKGWVEYNPNNNRISRFEWLGIPPGTVITVVIWDTLDPAWPDPIFMGTFTQDGNGPIPGNYQAVPDPTNPPDGMMIPPNIKVAMSSVTA